ncbi:hypothetical protein Vafri_2279, partial [Volvox africanus]
MYHPRPVDPTSQQTDSMNLSMCGKGEGPYWKGAAAALRSGCGPAPAAKQGPLQPAGAAVAHPWPLAGLGSLGMPRLLIARDGPLLNRSAAAWNPTSDAAPSLWP